MSNLHFSDDAAPLRKVVRTRFDFCFLFFFFFFSIFRDARSRSRSRSGCFCRKSAFRSSCDVSSLQYKETKGACQTQRCADLDVQAVRARDQRPVRRRRHRQHQHARCCCFARSGRCRSTANATGMDGHHRHATPAATARPTCCRRSARWRFDCVEPMHHCPMFRLTSRRRHETMPTPTLIHCVEPMHHCPMCRLTSRRRHETMTTPTLAMATHCHDPHFSDLRAAME
jgi:hypothetical protein